LIKLLNIVKSYSLNGMIQRTFVIYFKVLNK